MDAKEPLAVAEERLNSATRIVCTLAAVMGNKAILNDREKQLYNLCLDYLIRVHGKDS